MQGYVLIGANYIDDDNNFDKDVIGVSHVEPAIEVLEKHLERHSFVILQFWMDDTLVQEKEYSGGSMKLTFNLVHKLQAEMEAAKQVIVDNTKILNNLGLL